MVNVGESITKNWAVMLINSAIIMSCSLLLTVVSSRYFGDVRYGKYAFALAFANIFNSFSDLGLSTVAVREVARDESLAGKYLGNIFIIKLIICSAVFLLMCGVVFLTNQPIEKKIITCIVGAGITLFSVSNGIRWVFQAFQKMKYEAFLGSLTSILTLFLGMAVILLRGGLIEFSLIIPSGYFVALILSLIIVYKKFPTPQYEIDLILWRFLGRVTYPFALMLVFVAIYLNIDSVMLSFLKGDAPTGWYNASSRLIVFIKQIPNLYIPAVFPVMASLYKLDARRFKLVLDESIKLMLLIGIPIAVVVTLLADRIILPIYGIQFTQSISSLRILVWAAIVAFVSGITALGLVSAYRQKLTTWSVGIGLLINITANFVLIPIYAHVGTSVSILLTEIFVTSMTLFWAKRILDYSLSYRMVSKFIISAMVAGLVAYILRNLNLLLVTPLSILVYLLVLILIKGINKEETKMIISLFLREKREIKGSDEIAIQRGDN